MSKGTRTTPDCPACERGVLRARDSRQSPAGGVLRRRLKICDACGYKCTTHEIIVADTSGFANGHVKAAWNLKKAIDVAFAEAFPTVAQTASRTGRSYKDAEE